MLIVDSGSTKADWCLIENREGDDAPEVLARFQTPGMNALMMSEEEMAQLIAHEALPWIDAALPGEAYFYGAGCVSAEVCQKVKNAFLRCLKGWHVEVATDMLAAARALCGHQPGIACILGTGSNSCLYDGKEIVMNTPPLGYILGDEGSGASLGRILLGDVLKEQLTRGIILDFYQETGLDKDAIINRVYREPAPNRFLASFTKFIKKHIDNWPSLDEMVEEEFRRFIERNLYQYQYCPACPKIDDVNFVGSVAYYFQDQLQEAIESCGYRIGIIERSPMEGLMRYHSGVK